jgi:hypothetical protein
MKKPIDKLFQKSFKVYECQYEKKKKNCQLLKEKESELTKLRDLVEDARELIDYVAGNDKQYSMVLHAKNWLDDYKELQDEKTRR